MPSPSSTDRSSPSRKPPSNFQSRGVQVRILMLVFSVMLVLVMMNEARKPENWYWMWAGQNGEFVEQSTQEAIQRSLINRPVDNRTEARPEAASPSGLVTISRDFGGTVDSEDPHVRALASGWSEHWEAISREERSLLYRALLASRGQASDDRFQLSESDRTSLADLNTKLDKLWQAYHQRARKSLETNEGLSEQAKESWASLIDDLETQWTAALAALHSLASEEVLSPADQNALQQAQQVLDALAMSRVDDGPRPREYDEGEAWFRLLEQLQTTDQKTLAEESMGYVGFVQLTSQPNEYRGKVITVRGAAILGYQVPAPKNMLNIEHFYVLWVKPATGENSPIVVYALDLPPEFPTIPPRETAGETVLYDEQVEFTGYFFKRWVYPAKRGVRDAPLMLAGSPKWEPHVPVMNSPPGLSALVIGMAAAAVFALGVAVFAYRSSRWKYSLSNPEKESEQVVSKLKLINEEDVSPKPGEMLRKLAEEEGDS